MIDINQFYKYFDTNTIIERFNNKIQFNCSAGLDRINVENFTNNLFLNANLIHDKIIEDKYSFTRYTEFLISKGKDKLPRIISCPTIRDKLTLSLLHTFLQNTYNIDNRLIHTKIHELSTNLKNYSHYIKIDIKGFYSNIQHSVLEKQLAELLPQSVISLINKAIKTQTVPKNFNHNLIVNEERDIGIPEGLSISNILAEIYLLDFDRYFKSISSMYFCRYVDDILVLCNEKDLTHLKREIEYRLNDLDLSLNEEKVSFGQISDQFIYLGYVFDGIKVSVRPSSINKFEHSLEKLFLDYHHSKICENLFVWKLNLKITGCINENRKYGWLYFYSQINDMELLKHLDWLVEKLLLRFKISKESIKVKKFVKSYYEIHYNLHASNYLMNANNLTTEDKKLIIENIYSGTAPANELDINKLFIKLLWHDLSKLEKDIQYFS